MDWATSLVTVIGTLGGAVVGAFFANWAQKAQLRQNKSLANVSRTTDVMTKRRDEQKEAYGRALDALHSADNVLDAESGRLYHLSDSVDGRKRFQDLWEPVAAEIRGPIAHALLVASTPMQQQLKAAGLHLNKRTWSLANEPQYVDAYEAPNEVEDPVNILEELAAYEIQERANELAKDWSDAETPEKAIQLSVKAAHEKLLARRYSDDQLGDPL